MADPSTTPVFILGCERSGSTWLANIFDAHADVEFWMEPFADYAGLFPGFPHRNEYLFAVENGQLESIRAAWKELPRHKYPLFYRPGLPLYRKAVDRRLASSYRKLRQILRLKSSPAIDRYLLLNLNLSAVPCARQARKSPEPALPVVKELRLNFKVGLMARAFPQARYVVPIRHPGAQIASILRLFSGGRLGELSNSLPAFARTIESHPRFEKYRRAVAVCNSGEGMAATLVPWWLINYEVLLEDLAQNKLQYHLVPHEVLCSDPTAVVARLFAFCGQEVDEGVSEFLRYSTCEGSRKPSPVDTVRDSSEYYKQRIHEADPSIMAGIRVFVDHQDKLGLMLPELGDYLARLPDLEDQPDLERQTVSGVK